MKIAFFSNFLNHHQLPLCERLSSRDDVEFYFVATTPTEGDRLKMGYRDMNDEYPFVVKAYEDDATAKMLCETADVMIYGAAPIEYLNIRMEKNLLTFYFSERPLKKGYYRRFIPFTRKKIFDQYVKFNDKNLYVLCASAYASYDLKICGFNPEKCFKWGYFPRTIDKPIDDLFSLKDQNKKVKILYAGRLLQLKRVIDLCKAVKLLTDEGIGNFTVDIIGDGEERQNVIDYINKNNLSSVISISPFIPADEVRNKMDESDVYFFGSDFKEGWGAVVNEAMNSACAVVSSHSVGACAYLIKDGKNGLIYECGNVKKLKEALKKVIIDKDFRRELSKNAYSTIKNEWSHTVASDRLISLSKAMLDGKKFNLFSDGVLSPATPLKNNWVKRLTKDKEND